MPSRSLPGASDTQQEQGVKLQATGLDTEVIRNGVPAGQRNGLVFWGYENQGLSPTGKSYVPEQALIHP